jgi:hypothetical protein
MKRAEGTATTAVRATEETIPGVRTMTAMMIERRMPYISSPRLSTRERRDAHAEGIEMLRLAALLPGRQLTARAEQWVRGLLGAALDGAAGESGRIA